MMKITIESDDLMQEEMLRYAMQVYQGCKKGINVEKNVKIKIDADASGVITQQGKVLPFIGRWE